MIGKKSLSDIRANILKAFSKAGLSPDAWMDKQISRATRAQPNLAEIETLTLVRDGLRSGGTKKQRSRARSR
jgi:hypothetical protein